MFNNKSIKRSDALHVQSDVLLRQVELEYHLGRVDNTPRRVWSTYGALGRYALLSECVKSIEDGARFSPINLRSLTQCSISLINFLYEYPDQVEFDPISYEVNAQKVDNHLKGRHDRHGV